MKNMTDKVRLDDRIILITGAGDGIGRAVSLDCAKRGATIILLGKTIQKLEQVYDEIIANGGPDPAIYPLDLQGASEDDYEDLKENIEKEFGHLDALLNNAGWLGASTPVEMYDTELWYKVLQTNLNAPFMLTKACIPLIKNSRRGAIAFTTDEKCSAYWGAYGVTKAAADNLMGILADELEIDTPIRVNSIDPGKVRTRMRALAYPGEDPMTVPAAEEIMDAYLYLMSAESKDVNGKIINCRKN